MVMNSRRSVSNRGVLGRVRAWAVAGVAWVSASAAMGQVERVDPNDPAAAAERNAAMEDMFEDMPFEINPAGMTSGEGMFGAFFGPSVTKGDFKSFIAILRLDKEQAEAAGLVYAQRLANYEAKGKPMQDMITEFMKKMGEAMGRGEQPKEPENVEQLSKAALDIQKEREAMAKGVMEDLKALASTEQLVRWPKVEMAERRIMLMRFQPMMMAPGSVVDIRGVLDATLAKNGMEQPSESERQRIEQAIDTLEVALDEQAKMAAPLDASMRSAGLNAKPSPEQQQLMMKVMGEGGMIAERVRTANETAVKSIAAALAEATKAEFMIAYRTQAFPAIYRVMHSERLLDAAVQLTDLTDEQRDTLTKMRADHSAKFKELRPQAADQLVEQNKRQAEWMAAKDDEAKTKAMERLSESFSKTARQDMKMADKEMVKQVRAMLTEAQRDKLPKRPRPNLPFQAQPSEVELK